jgi:hypothetical protein
MTRRVGQDHFGALADEGRAVAEVDLGAGTMAVQQDDAGAQGAGAGQAVDRGGGHRAVVDSGEGSVRPRAAPGRQRVDGDPPG